MAYFLKTLDLTFAVEVQNDDEKLKITKYANSFYRKNVSALTGIARITRFKLLSVQETQSEIRNIPQLAYIVRFTLSMEAPNTLIAAAAVESTFSTQVKRGETGKRDEYVLIGRTVT